jgi:hypothetical protein
MKRLIVVMAMIGAIVSPAVAVAGRAHTTSSVRHCGSFKFGTDGLRPGPSGITAEHVSCWFARATALLGAPPGWHCRIAGGLRFACRPRHGHGRVTFFGE